MIGNKQTSQVGYGSYISIFFFVILIIIMVSWNAVSRYETFKERQFLLASNDTESIGFEIDTYITYLRSQASQFSIIFQPLISRLAADPQNIALQEELGKRVQDNIRGAISFCLIDEHGETIVPSRLEDAGDCSNDMAVHQYDGIDSTLLGVHQHAGGFYFEILLPWTLQQRHGYLLLQIHPDDIAYILSRHQKQTGDNYLMKDGMSEIIDFTPVGTSKVLRRSFELSNVEQQRVGSVSLVPQTGWQVVHVFSKELFEQKQKMIVLEVIALSIGNTLLFLLLAYLIWSERRRGEQSERFINSILSNLPGVVFRRELNTSGRLDYPYISSASSELLNVSADELKYDSEMLFRAIHADDSGCLLNAIEQSAAKLTPLKIEYRIPKENGSYRWVKEIARPHCRANGDVVWDGVLLDISDLKKVEDQLRIYFSAIDAATDGVLILGTDFYIEWTNPAFASMTGFDADEIQEKPASLFSKKDTNAPVDELIAKVVTAGKVWLGEWSLRHKDGSEFVAQISLTPVFDSNGEIERYVSIVRDLTEQKSMESQLIQAEKMMSVGQLAAGIAHEINTPTQFVGDNVHFLHDVYGDLLGALDAVIKLARDKPSDDPSYDTGQQIDDILEQADIAFIRDEAPTAIEQALEGLSRIAKIVGAMKYFSHPGSSADIVDLNQVIESTVTVARNEWKYVADLQMDLSDELPSFVADSQLLGQTILNLIVNASHAIAEKLAETGEDKGNITITTVKVGDCAEIRISDTGTGIPENIRNRIFDPFFTTKDVGKGSGQGLAITYSGIVEKHHGSIDFDSTVGIGTTFIVRLPLNTDKQVVNDE